VKALGKEHPDVATSLNNLAMLYKKLGKNSQAKPLYQRSLAILEKSLGEEHPSTKAVRNNLQKLPKD
jgi:Tfp pilus assembly protein PilF